MMHLSCSLAHTCARPSFRTLRAVNASNVQHLPSSCFSAPLQTVFAPNTCPWDRCVVPCAMATEAAPAVDLQTNPIVLSDVKNEFLPRWDEVKAEHVKPGLQHIIADLDNELSKLEESVKPTWEGLVEPLERISDRISRAWGTVSHLKAVKDTKEMREAVEAVQGDRVKLSLRMSQSRPLYEAFQALRDSDSWESLTGAQKRIVESELRDFVLGGVALEGEEKKRFNEIAEELTALSTKFSNNVLDGTKSFTKLLTTSEEVDGLPESALALMAQQAKAKGHAEATPESGPWLVTLDIPSYLPVQVHCKNRALREELYRAFISRASQGESDNTEIINSILTLRKEKSKLLGYTCHADVSLATKMADLESAEKLLEELRVASYDRGVQELQETRDYAKEQGADYTLMNWDVSYWNERLKEAKYDISDEALRPYFALPTVLDGLFSLAKRLFGVDIEAADGQAAIWDPAVRFFVVKQDGVPKAHFFLDPYSRPEEKRGGAWMDEVAGQSRLWAPEGSSVRLPCAHMVCNQTPPIGKDPSLMTFREVETLFHEFGHALQHMLTQQEEGLVSGIRGVEWDAVELPSQFMENWCYDKPTLMSFAKHHKTGENLPDEMFNKLTAARTYKAASMMLRQVHFSRIDLELHSRYDPAGSETIFECDSRLAKETLPLAPLPEDRFLCGFAHIFAGGYSAGYYSYKWAEVLSADAFGAFEEAGLEDETKVEEIGRKFRDTVLALGGGVDPLTVFTSFRGRGPSTEALLRHSGLTPAAAA